MNTAWWCSMTDFVMGDNPLTVYQDLREVRRVLARDRELLGRLPMKVDALEEQERELLRRLRDFQHL